MTVTYKSCVILVNDRKLWRSDGSNEDCLLGGNTVQSDGRSCIQQGNLVTPWILPEDPSCIKRVYLKCRYISTRLHGVTQQEISIWGPFLTL